MPFRRIYIARKPPFQAKASFCNKLFEIEKTLENLSNEQRKSERLKLVKPVLDAFWAWIDSTRGKILPKSKLSEALAYALNHKKEFMNYLEDGNCSISNNLAENCIRPFTIGRKNWLFSGSPKGALASATVYSIIESVRQMVSIHINIFISSSANYRWYSSANTRSSLKITFPGVQKFKKPANKAKAQFTRVFAFFLSTGLFDTYHLSIQNLPSPSDICIIFLIIRQQ